jgi:hypothetical protein
MAGTRTIDDMMRSIRSYQESRAFLTALESDVFTAVGEGAEASQVAATILWMLGQRDLDIEALRFLLRKKF